MPVLTDVPYEPNKDYPHANYRQVMVGSGVAVHAALWFDHNNWTKPETVCGRDWLISGKRMTSNPLTCKRCAKKLSVIDRDRRRLEYMVKRDEELDALSMGVPADQATAWRDEWYTRVSSGKADN